MHVAIRIGLGDDNQKEVKVVDGKNKETHVLNAENGSIVIDVPKGYVVAVVPAKDAK